jgi:hypothetical protein
MSRIEDAARTVLALFDRGLLDVPDEVNERESTDADVHEVVVAFRELRAAFKEVDF